MTTMSSTPLGTAQPAPPLQQLPAAGLPTTQLPVFPSLRPDTIDARLQALEQNAHQQSQWQALFLASQTELATCKTKNAELKKEIDKLTLKLHSFQQRVNNDFSLASRHFNTAFHRLSQIEFHHTKAHQQLDERLTHTVQQQAAQADSFHSRYMAPLLSAIHRLLPGDQTDCTQSSISRRSPSVTEREAVDTPDASLLPSIVQQVISTLPPSQLLGHTAADQILAPHASQPPIEAAAVPPKRSASSIDSASASRPGNDASGVELPPELPSTLPTPAQRASHSGRMSNASTSSELKASPTHEVQQLAAHQTVELPSATAASSESSPGTKRKRTPSVEHIRTQIARRSTQSSIKSAGISPESTQSASSFETAPATLPLSHAVSSATPHVGTPPSRVVQTAASEAIRPRDQRPLSTPRDLAASQHHLTGHSTVPLGPQGGLSVAQSPVDISDTPAVHNRPRAADATVTKKQPPQRLLVPEAGDARVQPWQQPSPCSAQGLVKSLTSRSAPRAVNAARPDPTAKSNAPSLPERPSTADLRIVRGSSSTALSTSTEGRNSAPAQAPATHASPPPRRVTAAGGASRRTSPSDDRRSGMEAAHSRLGPSDAFVAHGTSSCDVEIHEGSATYTESLSPNWSRPRSPTQASPPTSPDVPLSSLASSTDSSWPRRSSAGPQASTAAVGPESKSSNEDARTTQSASARQGQEPVVRLRGLAAPNSNSASHVAAPPAEGPKRPSTAVRGALTADPRRKALLPTQPANLSGLSTSTASAGPIKPVAPLKHALPSKPLVSADQAARTQPDTSRSASTLIAPTKSPVQSVTPEHGAIVPPSVHAAERTDSSLPRSSASSSDLGRDGVGVQSRQEVGVRPSPHADADGSLVAISSRPRRRTSSGSAPASQAGQEPPQAPSAPLNTNSSARVQGDARPGPETPSSAESRQLPASAAVEKQQAGQLQPHRSLPDPDKHQAAASAHSAAPSSQDPSESTADQRQGERGSDQNQHVKHDAGPDLSKTRTLPRQHQSRVERLASVKRTWADREGRSPYYFMAFLGRSSRPTALVVTDDSQITEPLISEDLANELLQDGNASRARGCESWLEVDLSWPYDTVKPHDRTVGCPAWFRAERCQFLIVPRIYMKEGICLGRRELRHLNLRMVTKGAGGRPYLSVPTAYEQGVNLSAFSSHERMQHLTTPFQRLCHLAEVAVKRSQASWRVREGTKRRDNTDSQRSDSAHGDVSGSNALPSHHESRAWGRNTLPEESSFEAGSSHERDSMSRETGERRDAEHVTHRLSTSLGNATPLRRSTARDQNIDRGSSVASAEGSRTPELDSGSPLTPLSQVLEEEEEEDELMDETNPEHRSAPETLQDLTEDEGRAVIERTQRLLQEQQERRARPGLYGDAPPSGLQLMGSSHRFKTFGDATR
ncbi:hypothetical protein PaG_01376 [Moesziomyces aphidis]|uniref:Uncharacterized protein n=1 Tax=Moesziomyces aphidis TaxID=84754 RepID=W3VRL8_MOEAP|nr:hypothetical protein PaG_01376 [Moesziomyces aphidis]